MGEIDPNLINQTLAWMIIILSFTVTKWSLKKIMALYRENTSLYIKKIVNRILLTIFSAIIASVVSIFTLIMAVNVGLLD